MNINGLFNVIGILMMKKMNPIHIHLFTLPYNLMILMESDYNCILTKSTCSYDDDYLRCDRVNSLYYHSLYFTDSILSLFRFNNIQSSFINISIQ